MSFYVAIPRESVQVMLSSRIPSHRNSQLFLYKFAFLLFYMTDKIELHVCLILHQGIGINDWYIMTLLGWTSFRWDSVSSKQHKSYWW